jgi:hypothetical protein
VYAHHPTKLQVGGERIQCQSVRSLLHRFAQCRRKTEVAPPASSLIRSFILFPQVVYNNRWSNYANQCYNLNHSLILVCFKTKHNTFSMMPRIIIDTDVVDAIYIYKFPQTIFFTHHSTPKMFFNCSANTFNHFTLECSLLEQDVRTF